MIQKAKDLWKSYFRIKMPQQTIIKEIYEQCTKSLKKCYQIPQLKKYIQSLPVHTLLHKAVEIFVGSHSSPRNPEIAFYLIDLAQSKAKNEKQKTDATFFRSYLRTMQGYEGENYKFLDVTADAFEQLAQKGHPLTNYYLGKQAFQVADKSLEADKRQQQFDIQHTLQSFDKSMCHQQYFGIYYVARIMQSINSKVVSQQEIKQMFTIAAGLGHSLSLFSLAQIYKHQLNNSLYIRYLKQAAEKGLLEAQYNLGVQYMRGQFIKKDQFKALAWFNHAGMHGFIPAKYNASMILLKGTECKKVMPNRNVALKMLIEIQIRNPDQVNIKKVINQVIQKHFSDLCQTG